MDNIRKMRSRRIRDAFVLTGAAVFLSGAVQPSTVRAADVVELKMAHFVSTLHVQHQESFLPFAQTVEKLTQGRVRIKVYAGGVLGGPMQLPDAVRTGIADMAFIVPSYTAGRFPRSSVLDLPFLSDQARKATRIFYDLYDPFLAEDYRDYKVLWLYSSDPGQLFAVTGPIKTLENLKGKKIRSPSAAMSDALLLLGAHPVSMPISDLHGALDKRVIDGMLSPTTAIHDFKLYDQIRYGTRINLFSSLLMIVMNREKYVSLPDFARKALDDASGRNWGLRASEIYDRLDSDIVAQLKASGRVTFETISLTERQRFRERLRPMETDWVTRQTSRQLPANEILAAMHAAVKGNP
jgi:TRAP-type C4-dicarboxylate transport system substrate-binding protein